MLLTQNATHSRTCHRTYYTYHRRKTKSNAIQHELKRKVVNLENRRLCIVPINPRNGQTIEFINVTANGPIL